MINEEVISVTKRIVAESLMMSVEELDLQQQLKNDLGINSLEMLDLFFKIEKQFKIKLRRVDFYQHVQVDPSLATLQDLVDLINQLLLPPSGKSS